MPCRVLRIVQYCCDFPGTFPPVAAAEHRGWRTCERTSLPPPPTTAFLTSLFGMPAPRSGCCRSSAAFWYSDCCGGGDDACDCCPDSWSLSLPALSRCVTMSGWAVGRTRAATSKTPAVFAGRVCAQRQRADCPMAGIEYGWRGGGDDDDTGLFWCSRTTRFESSGERRKRVAGKGGRRKKTISQIKKKNYKNHQRLTKTSGKRQRTNETITIVQTLRARVR